MSLDDLHAQLRGALDEQFAAIKQQYNAGIAAARDAAAAEARHAADVRLAEARAEFDAQAERHRRELEARIEADSRARDAADAHAREAALAEWRAVERQLRDELDAWRHRAAEAEAEAASHAIDEEVEVAATLPRLAAALRALEDTRSLTQALDTLLARAASIAGRAELFMISGDRLRRWSAHGGPSTAGLLEAPLLSNDLFARAAAKGRAMRAPAASAPDGAPASAPDTSIAAPITIGGSTVAILHAYGDAPPGAFDMIDVLARYASMVVALRTAIRVVDARHGASGGDRARLGSA